MKFEFDAKKQTLTSTEIHLPTFGKSAPHTLTVYGYDENEPQKFIEFIEKLYDDKQRYLNEIYSQISEICPDWDELNPDGSPLTNEQIADILCVQGITVSHNENGTEIVLDADFDTDDGSFMGGYWVDAYIELETGKVVLQLEG